MAGSITVSSITLDSDNNFSIKSNTGATLFFANTSGVDIANSIGATAITSDKILSIANTKISGNIISSQITSVANTQISGNITAAQITSVANTQLTGLIQAAQIGSANATLVTSGTLPTARLPTGTVLQVVQGIKTDTFVTSASATDTAVTGLTVSITPTSASNKILVFVNLGIGSENGQGGASKLTRTISATVTQLSLADSAGSRSRSSFAGSAYRGNASNYTNIFGHQGLTYLDSPTTTSAITYGVQVSSITNGTYINRTEADGNSNDTFRGVSYITVMEIAA